MKEKCITFRCDEQFINILNSLSNKYRVSRSHIIVQSVYTCNDLILVSPDKTITRYIEKNLQRK